jgi:hypothetical protein
MPNEDAIFSIFLIQVRPMKHLLKMLTCLGTHAAPIGDKALAARSAR